jgi:L-aspartate oxidase
MTPPRYLQHFDTALLPQVFADVLVVGSGIAGHCATLAAAEAGARVLMLTKEGPLESSTLYAQGGIAAPLALEDSVDAQVQDTVRAGDGLCHEDVVRSIVGGGAEAIDFLAASGVRFDRDPETGAFRLGREGGHSCRRIAHVKDATGREFQRALSASVIGSYETRRLDGAFVVDLLTVDDRCVGVLALVGGELRAVWAGAVVLATGGAGRLFRESTNPSVTTGDGLAMAYRAGAELRDMEFMQFHPTVLYVPGAGRKLLSEAARGEGAVVRDVRGRQFLFDFDERGELAPRDVVSRSMVAHMLQHGDTHVLLDLTGIEEERLASRLPGIVATGREIGIDVTRSPLPIRPAAHYTVGGVVADPHGRTSVPGLLAAGEVTSLGLHGANRLASNSLLEGVVVGRRAGAVAAAEAATCAPQSHAIVSRGPGRALRAVDSEDVVQSVESLLWREAGVQRSGEGLAGARRELAAWSPLVLRREMPHPAGMEAQNLCLLASLLVDSALLREETRGVHWRTDHPERDDDRFAGHFHHAAGREPRYEPLPAGVTTT